MAYVLSLIAAPKKGGLTVDRLDAALTTAAQAGWRAGRGVWLDEGHAWECPIALQSGTVTERETILAALRHLAEDRECDVNILPETDRRKSLLVADMDSTMICQECIDELAVIAGVGEEIRAITQRAMLGKIPFETALEERVSRLAGLPAGAIQTVIEERLSLTSGGRTLVATMRDKARAVTMLISGGFTHFAEHVAGLLGFGSYRANELIIENGALTGRVKKPVLGPNAKVETLKTLLAGHELTAAQSLAVGDGGNDIAMLKHAGLGVAFHAKPAVRAQADACIDHGDLTALLYLQGYHRDEFAG